MKVTYSCIEIDLALKLTRNLCFMCDNLHQRSKVTAHEFTHLSCTCKIVRGMTMYLQYLLVKTGIMKPYVYNKLF